MFTTNCTKFKGEIENYLRNGHNNFDAKLNNAFSSLRVKTWLSRNEIIKKDGYPASHLLFILFILPVLKLNTVNSFCNRSFYQWSLGQKDAFYRFKQKTYRWRSFFYKLILEIFKQCRFNPEQMKDFYFVIDDTVCAKRGKLIENVSFVYDHCLKRSVLGYGLVTLGLFTGNAFYPIDFSYWFSNRRHPKSAEENIGDPRSVSGQMSYDAKIYSKLDLSLKMLKRAFNQGIRAGYILFDSWYAWPSFIDQIRKIDKKLHVICRLKDSKVYYEYNGKKYRLSELYQITRCSLRKDKRTGLLLKRMTVKPPGDSPDSIIVFAKGYNEPDNQTVKGTKKDKEPKWVAFFSTDTRLHASTIIKKYTKRWTTEVFYKESKQMLNLGKEQSNSFQAQVFSTTNSFLRYALFSYLNQKENRSGLGLLFEDLVDETASLTYAARLWQFFKGLFKISFSKIFGLFKIEEDFQTYYNVLEQALQQSTPILGCET